MPRNAVVVGCGTIGSALDDGRADRVALSHASGYESHDRTRLVAGVDPSHDRRTAFESARSVPAYSDVGSALAAHEVDLVSICTPPEARLDVVESAIDAGVEGILCEKPLAGDTEAASRVVNCCREAGVHLAVNYTRRYLPGCHTARALLETGEIGETKRAIVVYNKGFLANGSHMIDLARWWFGEASDVQFATGDDPHAVVRFGDTLTHVVHAGNHAFNHVEVDVYGEDGRLQLLDHGGTLAIRGVRPSSLFEGFRELGVAASVPTGLEWMCYFAVNDLVRAVVEGDPPACDGESALETLALCERLASG